MPRNHNGCFVMCVPEGNRRENLATLIGAWFLAWIFHCKTAKLQGPWIIGKLLVPLGWYPSCLTLQGVLQKGIYPINTHYIRCIWGWLLRVPCQGYHHFPYEWNCLQITNHMEYRQTKLSSLGVLTGEYWRNGWDRENDEQKHLRLRGFWISNGEQ